MRKPRSQPDDIESPEGWTDEEAPEKYEALTMGDNEDQDDEETLAVQSDAREEVEPRAPAMRTRGASPRRKDADTREDAGAKLDDPNGAAAQVNTPQPPRAKRGSGRPTSSKAYAGKSRKARSRKRASRTAASKMTAARKRRTPQGRSGTRKGGSRGR